MRTKAWWAGLGDQTLVESAWERQMLSDGLEAYEQSQVRSNGRAVELTDSGVGQKIIRDRIKRASDGVYEAQKRMLTRSGAGRDVRGAFISLPADTLAMIALRVVLNRVYSQADPDQGANFQFTCTNVSKAVETELNFRNWVTESRLQAKEYAKKMGLDKSPTPFAMRLIQEEGNVTSRSIRNWKKAFEELNEYSWSKVQHHYVGETLIMAVVEALPDTLEVHVKWTKGRKVKFIRLTPEFLKEVQDRQMSLAASQTSKKPMLATPEGWEDC